jgi:hypothetical protein
MNLFYQTPQNAEIGAASDDDLFEPPTKHSLPAPAVTTLSLSSDTQTRFEIKQDSQTQTIADQTASHNLHLSELAKEKSILIATHSKLLEANDAFFSRKLLLAGKRDDLRSQLLTLRIDVDARKNDLTMLLLKAEEAAASRALSERRIANLETRLNDLVSAHRETVSLRQQERGQTEKFLSEAQVLHSKQDDALGSVEVGFRVCIYM